MVRWRCKGKKYKKDKLEKICRKTVWCRSTKIVNRGIVHLIPERVIAYRLSIPHDSCRIIVEVDSLSSSQPSHRRVHFLSRWDPSPAVIFIYIQKPQLAASNTTPNHTTPSATSPLPALQPLHAHQASTITNNASHCLLTRPLRHASKRFRLYTPPLETRKDYY